MPASESTIEPARPTTNSMANSEESSRRAILCAMVLLAITLAAYVPVIAGGGFIWDDDDYLTNNPYVQSPDGIDEIWELEPFQRSNTRQYYPMVFTTFWIEHALWELNPVGYHFVNVLLHAVNSILLWRLLVMIRVPGAWIAAAIFALHPVHVESVAWITERKNVLSLFFYLTAAWAYLRFDTMREKTDPDERRNIWGWYGAALVLFVAALLSKSVTCSLPAAMILVHLWRRQRLSAVRLMCLVPFFAIGLALALNTAMLERVQVGAIGDAFDHSIVERSLIASKALLFYPWKLLVPIELIFIYPRWEIDAGNLASFWSVFIVLLVIAGCITLYLKGRRGIPLAAAFYAGTALPALGFFNVYPHLFSFVADHFVYHASIGLVAIIGALVAAVLNPPKIRAAVMAAPLALLFILTWRHGQVYQSSESLWRATVERNPNAWMAHNNLAGDLLDRVEEQLRSRQGVDTNLVDEARMHAEAAVEINPEHHTARSNLAEALRLLGRPVEGIPHMQEATRLRPNFPGHHWKLGDLYRAAERTDEAIAAYRQSITLIEEAAEARGVSPWGHVDYANYKLQLGQLLVVNGYAEQGEQLLRDVVQTHPNTFGALFLLAQLAEQRGDSAGASRYFEQIIDQRAARSPQELVSALMQYIRFLTSATDPAYRDLAEAERLAGNMVRESGGRDPAALLVLASVQHAGGRADEAKQTAEQAQRLAESMGLQSIADQARQQIDAMTTGNSTTDDG